MSSTRRDRPTLADVAAHVGVSAKTVSNVMLDRPHVASSTRTAVLAAAAEIGYEANLAGRGLASGRSGRIAVVVPNLYQPYFADMVERLIVALDDEGLRTTLRLAPSRDAEVAAVTEARDVDGVIVCPHFAADDALAEREPGPPVVQIGGPVSAVHDCVLMGEYEGMTALVEHLLATGRRRPALVWNAPGPGRERFDACMDVFQANGIDFDPTLLAVGSDWDRRASGYEAIVGLLRSGRTFDSAICINDALAVGVLRALRSHGVRVPDDVAVTGFDNTDESEFTLPSLTSVSPEQASMVAAGVGMLLDRLAGDRQPPRIVRTGAHVIVRDSTT